MSGEQKDSTPTITIEVTPDRMQAWVKVASPEAVLTPADVLAALANAKIAVDDSVKSRVDAFLASLSMHETPPDRFLAAEGRPAVEGQDASFVWDARFEKTRTAGGDDAPINYYEISNIFTTESGAVVGRMIPAKAGEEGVDVCGTRLKPKRRPVEIQLGKGVELSPTDSHTVISTIAGRVSCEQGVVSVCEALDVKGDVDLTTGSISSSVDVCISGTIRDNFEVKSEKSIVVGGCIDQATVLAQGDVSVRNGILGRGKGVVTSGGQCVAKFCDGAILIAAGDVKVVREVMNSSVYAEGRLYVERGSVIGGSTYAKEGAEVAELGNASGTSTELVVGIHPSVLGKARSMSEECREKQKVMEKITATVRPLMGNLKRLTAQQREQITELVSKLEPLKQSVAETEKARDALLAQASPKSSPSVLVSRTVHENVRIRVGEHETKFSREMRGPIRIELRKVDNVTQFVAANQLTGSTTVLPTTRVSEKAVEPALCGK